MTLITTVTLEEHNRLIDAWHATGTDEAAQIEFAAHALVDLALHLASPTVAAPLIILAGQGLKGSVGMAAARLLHEKGAAMRLVVSGPIATLSMLATEQYQRLRALGIPVWGLAMAQSELDTQEPIHWHSVALIVDTLLDAELRDDPEEEAADLIRMANATRRPILSYDVPSGVSDDRGYIMSPCIRAAYTLCVGLPRHGVIEAAPVSGELWLVQVEIPALIWDSLRLPPRPTVGERLANLGPARGLRPSPE